MDPEYPWTENEFTKTINKKITVCLFNGIFVVWKRRGSCLWAAGQYILYTSPASYVIRGNIRGHVV